MIFTRDRWSSSSLQNLFPTNSPLCRHLFLRNIATTLIHFCEWLSARGHLQLTKCSTFSSFVCGTLLHDTHIPMYGASEVADVSILLSEQLHKLQVINNEGQHYRSWNEGSKIQLQQGNFEISSMRRRSYSQCTTPIDTSGCIVRLWGDMSGGSQQITCGSKEFGCARLRTVKPHDRGAPY